MKAIFLFLFIGLLILGGCSKSTSSNRDAFVGNYHMIDTFVYTTSGSHSASTHYNMYVVANPSASDQIIVSNLGSYGLVDTGTVNGTLVTFNTKTRASSATLSGSTITLVGDIYTASTGYASYASGTGTKY